MGRSAASGTSGSGVRSEMRTRRDLTELDTLLKNSMVAPRGPSCRTVTFPRVGCSATPPTLSTAGSASSQSSGVASTQSSGSQPFWLFSLLVIVDVVEKALRAGLISDARGGVLIGLATQSTSRNILEV